MSVELNDIRKKITVKTPKGATIVLWSDTLWSTTSRIQNEAVKHMKTDTSGKAEIDTANMDVTNLIDQVILDRIVSWDYEIEGKPLPVTLESMMSLPTEEVQFIQNFKEETEKEQNDFLAQ